jgi:hypothetical protein
MDGSSDSVAQGNQAPFRIPRKSIAVGYQPIEPVSRTDSQENNNEKVGSAGRAPKLRRRLTALRRFPRWLAALLERPWLSEIISLVLACIAFTTIVITLAIHQGRTLQEWPLLISINTLVAIFTAIFKAALVMPVAEGKLGRLS